MWYGVGRGNHSKVILLILPTSLIWLPDLILYVLYSYTHTHTRARARVCIYIYVCVCVYTYICIYMHIYTHTWMLSCSVMSDSFATPWTAACQVRLSMGFSRQRFWSGLSFSSPGDLPDPGIEPVSSALARRLFITDHQGSPYIHTYTHKRMCVYLGLVRSFLK